MSVLTAVIIGLATGIVFGFALEKSRVFEPGIIVGQMQLRSFIMLKVFLAAVITGLVALAVMNGAFGVPLQLKALVWKADIVGGLVLGAGIALAGACPGTTLAQIGAGYRDAWFVLLGGIAGAITYGYFDAGITAFFAEKGDKLTFSGMAHLPFWVVALGVAAALTVALMVLERLVPWREEVGRDVDGVLPRESEAAHAMAGGAAHRT
ncbi:MAG: YeeE/YedE thiosulfate transporter family protein [Hyphomicrobiaceae bacterium]|nr:YeeE/YedE thiosulfate transporter family protein [Hyphomicrobiaceae bacterium]